ncbi:MAG: hypothetical protein ACYTEN_11495 [Planctomycetota bacterium]|jgi:preprotein translocase subunit YajC
MTAAGWIFMIVSWAVIIGIFGFCMYRTLRPSDKSKNESKQQPES